MSNLCMRCICTSTLLLTTHFRSLRCTIEDPGQPPGLTHRNGSLSSCSQPRGISSLHIISKLLERGANANFF